MEHRIEPESVTKPIQLLAAWLVGLIVVDSAFLTGAEMITRPDWASSLLVIAAVANVPLFLVSLFLLQTRFRPEMQEDPFYAKYLEVQQTTRKPETMASDVHGLRTAVVESGTRTIEMVEGLQLQVSRIIEQLSTVSGTALIGGPDAPAVAVIETALEGVRSDLSEAKREIQWQSYKVQVNDLLTRYEDIVTALERVKIPIRDTFGSTSHRSERPDHYVLAFGRKVPIDPIREVLRSIAHTVPEYLEYVDSDVGEHNIYIGGYGYADKPVLKLDASTITEILESNMSAGELRNRIIKSPIKLEPVVNQD